MSPPAREVLHWGLYVERMWPDPKMVADIRARPGPGLTARQIGEHTRSQFELAQLRDILMPPDEEEVNDG